MQGLVIMRVSFKKNVSVFLLTCGLIISLTIPSAIFAQSDVSVSLGGWSEEDGNFSGFKANGFSAYSTPTHTGTVEAKEEGAGVLWERVVGKTSWSGVYHYSRARFEGRITGNITADSGRVWGTSETAAYSGWIDRFLTDWTGKTYYGNQ